MSSSRLKVDDTPVQVSLCAWHMRRVFRDERILSRYKSKELVVLHGGTPKRRRNPSPDAPSLADAPFNVEVIIGEASTNTEIARCHWFVGPDGITPVASGLPDPKEINLKAINYHLTGRANPSCEHCVAGISTYSDEQGKMDA